MIEYCSNTTESEAQFTPWLMTVAFSKELKKKKKKSFVLLIVFLLLMHTAASTGRNYMEME